jgi:prolyl-tRNA synthetase
MAQKITSKDIDYSRWYTDLVLSAQLADYAPVKGCMVIRPYGFALWENMKRTLDSMIRNTGVRNAYFPLFIPESFIHKEKEHIEGFSPELAVVTYGGGKELEEKLVIRPTSETIMYSMFAKWIHSFRDLPLLLNQWANIVRWELRTRLFIRTTEFLWQEGHTAHATYEEAQERTIMMLKLYKEFVENKLAIPVISGYKTKSQKFAGALKTYCIEAMMGDKKALQMGTSHNLGQNFAKAFNIQYQTEDNRLAYVWQTSWGVSTRLIGGVVMVHGDNQGLILPPEIAPIQAIIIPIYKKEREKERVLSLCERIKRVLDGEIRIDMDIREQFTPGWKFNEWEMKGIPLRIEIGPRDVERNEVTLKRRDKRERISIPVDKILDKSSEILRDIQKNLFENAERFMKENTKSIRSYVDFKDAMDKGNFVEAYWCGNPECEEKIQKETKATIRCVPSEQKATEARCIYCGKKTKLRVIFARAY